MKKRTQQGPRTETVYANYNKIEDSKFPKKQSVIKCVV